VLALLTRLIVIASTLLAVAAGLWPLAGQPAVLAVLVGLFLGTAALARWRAGATASVVLLFAYTAYGAVRLVAGPQMAALPFWLAAFAGLALGGAGWTRWQAADGWRTPLAWWALVVAISWPLAAARELNYSLTPSLAAGPIITSAIVQMTLALWMDRLLASARDQRSTPGSSITLTHWAGPLLASALASAGAALYQWQQDPSWLSGEPWISLGRTVGMMGDANPLGVATALWAPLAWTLFAGGPAATLLGGLLALVLWTAAWLSGSRTIIILVVAGVAALAWIGASARRVSPLRLTGVLAVAAAALAGLLVVAGPRVPPNSPVARLYSAAPRGSVNDLAHEWLWRRDGYGLAAVEAIREHPITGVGVGRFPSLSTGYHQRLTGIALPPDNAQSLWRHTFAEQGLLGLLPLLWLTLLTLRALVSTAPSNEELMLRVMVAAMGVALLFGYPVQDAAIAITLGTLVAAVGRARVDDW
jgi:hypothetical protein